MVNDSEDLEKTFSRKIREASQDGVQELVKEYLMKCADRLKKQIQMDEALSQVMVATPNEIRNNFGLYGIQNCTMSTAAQIQELQSQISQTYSDLKMQNIWPKW